MIQFNYIMSTLRKFKSLRKLADVNSLKEAKALKKKPNPRLKLNLDKLSKKPPVDSNRMKQAVKALLYIEHRLRAILRELMQVQLQG